MRKSDFKHPTHRRWLDRERLLLESLTPVLRLSIFVRLFKYPPRAVLTSFFLVIMAGTALLMLPLSAVNGEGIGFVDSFFLSTSAACVTGLSVLDISSQLTLFGQLVILTLIQIGGLGIMTLSTFFIFMLSGRIGFTQREVLIDTFSQDPIKEMAHLLRTIVLVTFTIETVGAIILTIRFNSDYPLAQAVYYGVFHSVSAFCNAGFSLFNDSFVAYRGDWVINLVLITLITLGGFGFLVIMDIFTQRRYLQQSSAGWRGWRGRFGWLRARSWRRYWYKLTLHTRVVFLVSSLLVLVGTVLFFGMEYMNSLQGLPLGEKFLASLFQSVTARTAGFNTLEIGQMTNAALMIFLVLMFIGASPGSCGGGIKTTTFAVLMSSVFARFRFRTDVNLLQRRIPEETVSRATTVISFSVMAVVLFSIILMVSEVPRIPHQETRGLFMDYVFEVFSAFATVGLSVGVTSTLSVIGKLAITILMFVGRLGPLTVALAMHGRQNPPQYKYMQSNLLVG